MLRTVVNIRKSLGFTLIELIVSLGLVSIILTATFTIFSAGQKAYKREENKLYAQQNVRQAFLWLSTSLRQARAVDVISENEIRITTGNREQITFYFQNGVLYRRKNSGTNPVAELSNLRFAQPKGKHDVDILISISTPSDDLAIKTKVTPFGSWIN